MSSWPSKDPNEVLDYVVDWQDANSPVLVGGETITASLFEVTTGTVVIDSDTNDDTTATVWLSGGTIGEVCEVLNRIVTSAGRVYDKTTRLRIRRH